MNTVDIGGLQGAAPGLDRLPGWYGKLAMLGDFASRRLDPAWVQACDGWLAAGLRASQDALGARWLDCYLAAPVWRFVWGPGVIDARWWFGVWMPSCDRVGRYFPLVIVQPRERAPTDRVGLDQLELWWTRCAQAGLATLADGASLEGFERALQACPPWPAAAPRWGRPLPAPEADGRPRWQLPPGGSLGALAAGLAAEALAERLQRRSLWWSQPAPEQPARCVLWDGLPAAADFAGLLQG